MFCPNCGNKINDNEVFCANCGTKVENNMNPSPSNEVNDIGSIPSKEENVSLDVDKVNSKKTINKTQRDLIIICIVLLVIVTGVSIFLIVKKQKLEPTVPPEDVVISDSDTNNSGVSTKEEKYYSTYDKIKQSYIDNKIDYKEYFNKLVYCLYDTSKLESEYKSEYYTSPSTIIEEIESIVEKHKEELDKDMIRYFLNNYFFQNVTIASGEISYNLSDKPNYSIQLLTNTDGETHNLDKVRLSSGGHFLIWYTDKGNDGITQEQLEDIASGLENTINDFKSYFGIDYSYSSFKDNKLSSNYKNAKNILQSNGIPLSTLDTAMSVYVYDLNSDNVLAQYTNPVGHNLFLDLLAYTGLIIVDTEVAYPNIKIASKAISDENQTLKQLYNHELFHHYQILHCKKICYMSRYSEGMANFASALVTKSIATNNFLNGWASVYAKNVYMPLDDINDGNSYGYGTFPYWYAYSEVVNDWANVLLDAHLEKDIYKYIFENTSKEDLIKVSDKLVYRVLTNDVPNKALYSNSKITIKEEISQSKNINEKIDSGSIIYYKLTGKNTVKASSSNEYVGLKIYGYGDDKYELLASDYDKIEVDLSYYRYNTFYLAINNADINKEGSYSVEIVSSEMEENQTFNTTFKNYNIEIKNDIKVAGISTSSVSKGVVDELHQKEYLEMETISISPIPITNKMYHDFNSGYSYVTQPFGGDVWWREKSATQMIDVKAILNKLLSMKDVTKIDNNHYKVKMSKNDITGLLSSSNIDASKIKGEVFVEVYTKDKYIEKLEYDFSNIIDGIESYKTTINFSNYDNAGDVEIPKSVIDNAKTQ